ncbi:perosamine synthetase [Lysinibacillus alkalisoli]|uniref:Perosamine synthetase n=1 Tax=Lysinibacillus alkalisoli TaxID=1911548 RepID=A0A917D795_9BACI|nr:LegC family aminotransferase [Lysinibacillus alkalisoli]GGG13277.1 perosamine synthetase [Lysinibacillus alkalisoli]
MSISLIINQIKEIYGPNFIPLHEPTFTNKELEYITDCVSSGWVSSVGKYVTKFEEDLASYVGVKRAVAVVNGTAALHIALKICGVQPNDEVLMPALTFVATANAISYLQATPHFIDVSYDTLGVDATKLATYLKQQSFMKDGHCYNKETGRIIRAIVPMHTFGHAVELETLQIVCDEYNIVVVEDAAESLGTQYKGKMTGSFGKASAVSFNGNKIITTGGGGAILTNDDTLADYAKHLTTTAKVPHTWAYEHDEVGYNYRMPNLNAALGCAQLEKMTTFLAQKKELTERYQKLFKGMEGVKLFTQPDHSDSNYWLQTLVLDPSIYERDQVLQELNDNGVMARPIWTPMNELKPYDTCPAMDLSVTEDLKKRIINIPSSPVEVK